MIYFILTLFFASLISIVFMIGRKLALVKSGEIAIDHEAKFEVPYLEEVKYLTIENVKKYEHLSLVMVVKLYIQFAAFLKKKYEEIKMRIQHFSIKHHPDNPFTEKTEASKFLKIVSNYKEKITEITHKIQEEENNL